MRKLISTGSAFETEAGYSRAVLDGTTCYVAGTTGCDYSTMEYPEGAADQTRQVLSTIAWALGEVGMTLEDVVRVRIIVSDRQYVADVACVLGEAFAETRPASTMIIAQLIDPWMKVEIDATAVRH